MPEVYSAYSNGCSLRPIFDEEVRDPLLDRKGPVAGGTTEERSFEAQRRVVHRADEQRQKSVEKPVVRRRVPWAMVHGSSPIRA